MLTDNEEAWPAANTAIAKPISRIFLVRGESGSLVLQIT